MTIDRNSGKIADLQMLSDFAPAAQAGMAETACRVRAGAGARGLNPAGLFGAVTRIPFRLAALSAGRATLRPEVTRALSPCHAACALSRTCCGRLRKLRAAECHEGGIRDDRNERGTSEGRIAEALERIDGNLGRIADAIEEGGLNDIADAFTIIAMAITGMELSI